MAVAGPYSQGLNDPTNLFDAPVPGFVGPDGEGKARLDDGLGNFSHPRNRVNPLFFGWALGATEYRRADGETGYSSPSLALGPVTGDNFDVVSLGDLSAADIASQSPVGSITLQFTNAALPQPLSNLPGADFVVFENGFLATTNTGGAGVGGILGELAYVEVSSDGVHFARFPSTSLTTSSVGAYGSFNPTNVFNLAGKHVNAYGESWGTPFDLSALASDPLVMNGTVDLSQISHVRLVDIPGNGAFLDQTGARPIYDPWRTFGSGGLDLEAIGAISVPVSFESWQDRKGLVGSQRGAEADPDRDGVKNLVEYACGMEPLQSDVELLPKVVRDGASLKLEFLRDTRASEVRIEVQMAEALNQPWVPVARSERGGNLVPLGAFTPAITDVSASAIASVGVVRKQQISTIPGYRFLRIGVSLAP